MTCYVMQSEGLAGTNTGGVFSRAAVSLMSDHIDIVTPPHHPKFFVPIKATKLESKQGIEATARHSRTPAGNDAKSFRSKCAQ